MVKLYDKVEILEEIKTYTGKPILKGSRGTVLKVNPDSSCSVEVKIHNPMMLRSYEFLTLTIPENKLKVLEFKGNPIKAPISSFSDTRQIQDVPKLL